MYAITLINTTFIPNIIDKNQIASPINLMGNTRTKFEQETFLIMIGTHVDYPRAQLFNVQLLCKINVQPLLDSRTSPGRKTLHHPSSGMTSSSRMVS